MPDNPYTRFRRQDLTLNDYLAIDRTVMANERTVLAYARTALALAVVGGTCLKFFDMLWLEIIGTLLLIAGALVGVRGWGRYLRTKRLLAAALSRETGTPEHPLAEGAVHDDRT
jgi:putative membrane protein